MAHPIWLVLATDFDGSIRAEIPTNSFTFRTELNGPGGWAAVVPNVGHPAVTAENLEPGRTVIWMIDPGGTPRYSGILWQHQRSVGRDDLTVNIGGAGRWSYWHRRILRTTMTFTDQAPINMAASILRAGEREAPSGLRFIYHTDDDTEYSPTYHQYDYHNIGGVVEELAATADGGFDFDIDYTGDQKSGLVASFHADRRRGQDLDEVFDTASNMLVNSYICDASEVSNQVWMLGDGTGFSKTVGSFRGALAGYPRLQRTFTGDNVNDSTLLDARAELEVRQASACRRFITAEIYDTGRQPVVGTFKTGDTIDVRVGDPLGSVDERFRIMSVEVNINDRGKETVTVELVQDDIVVAGRIVRPDAWRSLNDLNARVDRLETQQ